MDAFFAHQILLMHNLLVFLIEKFKKIPVDDLFFCQSQNFAHGVIDVHHIVIRIIKPESLGGGFQDGIKPLSAFANGFFSFLFIGNIISFRDQKNYLP